MADSEHSPQPKPKRPRSSKYELTAALARASISIQPRADGTEEYCCKLCAGVFSQKWYAARHPCKGSIDQTADVAPDLNPGPPSPQTAAFSLLDLGAACNVDPHALPPPDLGCSVANDSYAALLHMNDTNYSTEEAALVAQATAAAVEAEYEVCN